MLFFYLNLVIEFNYQASPVGVNPHCFSIRRPQRFVRLAFDLHRSVQIILDLFYMPRKVFFVKKNTSPYPAPALLDAVQIQRHRLDRLTEVFFHSDL